MKKGQPYIIYVRLQHDSQFKKDLKKDWVNINVEQYFTKPKTGLYLQRNHFMFVAPDMYISNQVRLTATIFSTLSVVNV